jgi:uncharacterized protein (TIRG00374 family)
VWTSFTRYYSQKQAFLRESKLMSETKAQKSKHIFLFIRIAVVVCGIIWAIFWVSQEQRWENLVKIFREMNMGVFALTLGIFIVGQIIIGLRWWLLLRSQSIFIGFWSAVRLHFLGLFYNNCMPGSVGGDLIRAWYVTRHTEKRFEAALSVFVDRAIGLLSTLVIAAFFYILFLHGQAGVITSTGEDKPEGGLLRFITQHNEVFLAMAAVFVVVVCVFLLHKRGRLLLTKGWANIYLHGVMAVRKLRDAIVVYCSHPATILAVFGLTVGMQIMVITGFWFLGVELGIGASIKYYYIFFTLTWVLGAVPVSIGGAVVVEVALASMFYKFAGVGVEAASALALCQRIVWILASLPGGVIHLVGAHLPGGEFFIDSKEPMN